MSATTQDGVLVIADVSGYTSFVARIGPKHSHGILSGLPGLLVKIYKPLMTFFEPEVDAVFAYAGAE